MFFGKENQQRYYFKPNKRKLHYKVMQFKTLRKTKNLGIGSVQIQTAKHRLIYIWHQTGKVKGKACLC